MRVVYPAIFTIEESGYSVYFPDVKSAYTCGESLEHSMRMAEGVLGLAIAMNYIEKGLDFPPASHIKEIPTKDHEFVSLIAVDPTPYVCKKKTVRKNVTVPEWIAKRAEEAQLNFSEILTEGLQKKLKL